MEPDASMGIGRLEDLDPLAFVEPIIYSLGLPNGVLRCKKATHEYFFYLRPGESSTLLTSRDSGVLESSPRTAQEDDDCDTFSA